MRLRTMIAALVLAVFLLRPAHASLTLQNVGDAGSDPVWYSRVKARVLQDAFSIISESTGTANHANRILLASGILKEPDKWASRFTVATAGQSGPMSAASLAAVTDAQINVAVDSLLDGFATYAAAQ